MHYSVPSGNPDGMPRTPSDPFEACIMAANEFKKCVMRKQGRPWFCEEQWNPLIHQNSASTRYFMFWHI